MWPTPADAVVVDRVKGLGFRLQYERQVDEHFGNSVRVFRGDKLRLRMVRDRSQEFMDVGPLETDEWFDLELALKAAGADTPEEPLLDFEREVDLIESFLPSLERAFSIDRRADTRARIGELQKERMKVQFPGLGDFSPGQR